MVAFHSATVCFHDTQHKAVEWLHLISQAWRHEKQMNAELCDRLFHFF
jgi:hypothetical protein